jgi:hypothetical protein
MDYSGETWGKDGRYVTPKKTSYYKPKNRRELGRPDERWSDQFWVSEQAQAALSLTKQREEEELCVTWRNLKILLVIKVYV